MYLQQAGRVLRPAPGKHEAIILDHAGNCERHGLPDEERNWELTMDKNSKKSKSDNISVKVCPQCFAAQFSGKPECGYCGYTFPIQSREVEEKEGELVEVDPATLRRKRMQSQGRCKTLEDLAEEGRKRGYKRPNLWAKYVFNARQAKLVRG